jgi:hypothetical protein
MKKTVTLYFLIIALKTFPQLSVTRDYVLDSIPYGTSANIKPTADSGFVVIMKMGGSSGAYGALIVKFDSLGVKTWSRYISTIVTSPCDILPMNDGYFVTGYTGDDHIQLIRLDQDGNFLWRKMYFYYTGSTSGVGGAHFGFSLHKLSESTLMIYGVYEGISDGSPTVVLAKVQANGTLLWTKQYNQTGIYGRAISLEDNSILWNNYWSLTNADTLGNVKWNIKPSVLTYVSTAAAVQGGTAFCSNLTDSSFVYKLDDNGNLLWTSKKIRIKPASLIKNGTDILISGIATFYGNTYITLATLDYNGTVERQILFNSDPDLISARIVKTWNDRFAILAMYPNRFRTVYFDDPLLPSCGHTDAPLSSVPGDITFSTEGLSPNAISFYPTTTSGGNANPFFVAEFSICSESSTAAIDVTEQPARSSVRIYPNPANADAWVELPDEQQGIFTLYDLLGKPVFTKRFKGQKFEISAPEIVKGMYYYELKNSTEIVAKGKLLFQ